MMDDWDTSRFLYMRFHGPNGDYGSKYPPARLKKAAAILRAALDDGKTVYAFMNHDRDGYAVDDADKLRRYVERIKKTAPVCTKGGSSNLSKS